MPINVAALTLLHLINLQTTRIIIPMSALHQRENQINIRPSDKNQEKKDCHFVEFTVSERYRMNIK